MLNHPPPRAHVLDPAATGPLVVFVHGIEDEWRTWSPLASHFGRRWRTVALDMPWRAGNDYAWRWAASPSAWLTAGLDALGEVPSVLIGHSFGANAVLGALATSGPAVADCAALIAPLYRAADSPVTWRTFARSVETFEEQIGHGIRVRLRPRSGSLPADQLAAMLAKTCDRIGPMGFLAVFEQYVASGHLALGEARAPSLIIGGELDPGIARSHLEALAARLAGASLRYVPEHDHFAHVRHPAEVAACIEEFAGAVSPRQGSP